MTPIALIWGGLGSAFVPASGDPGRASTGGDWLSALRGSPAKNRGVRKKTDGPAVDLWAPVPPAPALPSRAGRRDPLDPSGARPPKAAWSIAQCAPGGKSCRAGPCCALSARSCCWRSPALSAGARKAAPNPRNQRASDEPPSGKTANPMKKDPARRSAVWRMAKGHPRKQKKPPAHRNERAGSGGTQSEAAACRAPRGDTARPRCEHRADDQLRARPWRLRRASPKTPTALVTRGWALHSPSQPRQSGRAPTEASSGLIIFRGARRMS